MSMLDIKTGQNHIAKIESHSFVDGEGVRCSVYVSGCPFQCKKCYNEKHRILNMVKHFLKISCKKYLKIVPSYISESVFWVESLLQFEYIFKDCTSV